MDVDCLVDTAPSQPGSRIEAQATEGIVPALSVRKRKRQQMPEIPTNMPSQPTSYGWEYNPTISFDENYIDLACLAARSSSSAKGHMGCVIVEGIKDWNIGDPLPTTASTLLVMTNNVTVFPPTSPTASIKSLSEIHAEQHAVSALARKGQSAEGTWAYVTFPPCKNCFMTLLYAGVKRMVFRRKAVVDGMLEVAKNWGVEIVEGIDREADVLREQRCRDIVAKYDANIPPEAAEPEEKRGKVESTDKAEAL
ncbi:hypothetical protein BC832DRAFT_569131 [Gaertneriomyces semiglobifer]|nr:hypothetical protein BC832DRAFT_569131 [Gaertneriomyces semiglobifer]